MAAPFGGENSIVIFIEILLKLLKKYRQSGMIEIE